MYYKNMGSVSLSFLSADLPSDMVPSCSETAAVPSSLDDAMVALFFESPSRVDLLVDLV